LYLSYHADLNKLRFLCEQFCPKLFFFVSTGKNRRKKTRAEKARV
jgi:hypothetical protein